MSNAAHKAWRTRRARKAAKTRKKNITSKKLSAVAKEEVKNRKRIQKAVASNLKKWWKASYLEGIPSKTKPLKCEICGETEILGLSIHHIDPNIKKGNPNYNSFRNKAPLCGTCHNIITYKKTKNLNDIVQVIAQRHKKAIEEGKIDN